MLVNDLIQLVQSNPETVEFSDVMQCIERHYDYTPTDFSNGSAENAAGTNEGSCKIFAFAKLNDLSKDETLALFGDYYREDVLAHPEGQDHANIRNFMQTGWDGIQFASEAITLKANG